MATLTGYLVHAICGYAMAYNNQMLVPLLKLRSQVIFIQKYSKDYMHTPQRTKKLNLPTSFKTVYKFESYLDTRFHC